LRLSEQLRVGTRRLPLLTSRRSQAAFIIGRPQPRILPEEVARGLAAAVRSAVASKIGEMDCSIKTATGPRPTCCVARLVGDGAHPKAPATILKHLRHERHAVKTSVFVQRCKDLRFAADFDNIPSTKARQNPTHATISRHLSDSRTPHLGTSI
jgi:hypothetical protein